MHESLMANQDSEILPNQDSEILPEDAEDTPCDFNELVSTMQPDCLTDTLSVYLESCEPLSVTDNDPSHNVDEPNTDSLVDPFNSIVLTESSEVRDNYVQNIKCSSTRRSTRKVTMNQKTDTKLAARKSRRASGKKPMLDLLSADVGRRRRSNLIPRARPSAWGVGGKIDEIFEKNVNANEDVESIKGRTGHKGGKRNTKKGLLLKFKVGTKAIQNCQFNTIPSIDNELESYTEVKIEASTLQSDIKDNYEKEVPSASNENLDKRSDDLAGVGESVENGCSDPGTSPDSEVINVIPETQISGTAEGLHSLKDCISHQSSDCGVGSAIPSPEIVNVNDVLSCDKFDHGEKQVEGSGSPRSAWVCCDDCHKWRRISAILADSIESTECRWICKDNMDKTFGDCSIPQEKSNADINEELELSEASGEEDACNTQLNSSQSGQKQLIDPPQLSWKLIKTNMFLHRNRKNQTIDEIMVCHCKPSLDGRMGCRDECLNRMLNIECVKGTCPCGDLCSNQQFQKRKYSKLKCFPCGKKGFGLQLQEDIPKGRFLIEYVGEVLDMPAYEARQKEYARKGHKHFYFMTLNGSEVIDACAKGNLGRFINHSCQPNCCTEKWMVNGEVCIGLFAIRDISKGEELTFDYNYVRVFGAAAKKCVCGSSRCRGVIGGDPLSSETVVSGDSDDEFLYENHNNKLDNLLITETQSASKNNSPVTDKFSMTPGHSEDVENENENEPDSLLAIDDDKNGDNTVIPIGSTEREVSFERSSSESKIEQHMDISFNKVTDVKHSESKKKPKANKNGNKCVILKPQSRPKQPSSLVKRGKSKNHKPPEIIDSKPLPLPPQKPKRIGEATLTGRFEAVQEALNTLLNADGGISKRRDAWKGYLKLLCLTAHSGNGEGIQSNRDLSMILDALLKTKSRTVLFDIINKNGLQMLHNLIKHYRKEFIKIPILRKLLKVLEFLAEGKILTLENILKPSPNGAISFKESILSLTEHTDKQVHQIARNFRDKWIPWYARKVIRAERDKERMEPHPQPISNFKTFQGQNSHSTDRRLPEVSDNSIKPPLTVHTPPVEASAASCFSSCTDGTRTRTRKRKSRWDQPGDITAIIQDIALVTNENQQRGQAKNEDMDEDAPPGFSSPVNRQLFASTSGDPVKGHLQDRYNSRLPTAFGLPSSVLRQIGIPPDGAAAAEGWVVAPAMTFHPFPPLPMYPRHVKEQSWRGCTDNEAGFQSFRNPNTLGRRYYKQHKWNNSRSGLPWAPNKYGPGTGPNYVGPNQGYGGNEGYNNNNNNNNNNSGVGSFYGGGGETQR